MTLYLYGDIISQPVRAIFALANIEKANMGSFQIVEISMYNNEHKKAEYKAINPFGKVPSLKEVQDGQPDFKMFESHAIMKYMCKSRNLP